MSAERQDEAVAKLGAVVRSIDTGKRRAFFPFSVGSACGGLSDLFLQPRRRVFTARSDLNFIFHFISFSL
jgi:hypothetical protein